MRRPTRRAPWKAARSPRVHHCARHAAIANPGSSAAPPAAATPSIRKATSIARQRRGAAKTADGDDEPDQEEQVADRDEDAERAGDTPLVPAPPRDREARRRHQEHEDACRHEGDVHRRLSRPPEALVGAVPGLHGDPRAAASRKTMGSALPAD
jgi:hypothetical protein